MNEPDEDWIDRIEKGTFSNISPDEPINISQQYLDQSMQMFDEMKKANNFDEVVALLAPLLIIAGFKLGTDRDANKPPKWILTTSDDRTIFEASSLALVVAWFIRSGLDEQRLVYRFPNGEIKALVKNKETDPSQS
jgi:hypothetical protein